MQRSKRWWMWACAGSIVGAVPQASPAAALMTERSAKVQEKRLQEVRALTAEGVANHVTIDDDLETVVTLKTAEVFLPKRGGFFDTLLADNMLGAMVGKSTGRTHWQLYQTIHHTEPDWRNLQSVNYETPNGPRNAPLTAINSDVECKYGVCSRDEVVGFDVTEELLEAIVAHHAGKPDAVWRFKFNARNGINWTDDIPVTEIAGALLAVRRYRAQKGFE